MGFLRTVGHCRTYISMNVAQCLFFISQVFLPSVPIQYHLHQENRVVWQKLLERPCGHTARINEICSGLLFL